MSSMERIGGYEGWSNRETWIAVWWMQNDRELYDEIADFIDLNEPDVKELSDYLKQLVYDGMVAEKARGIYGALLSYAVEAINYAEVAEYWMEELNVNKEEVI